jgi:DNA-binding LacI/PurR family transcriptional regulator
MGKRPTIKTIAQIAGVSHVAVSKALRGYPDISKETTEKIKKIAAEIGYTPNAFARNLSLGNTNCIGMIVPDMANDTAYNEVFNAVSISAAKKGLSVLLGSCNRDIELEKIYCQNMCENRVGSIIISPISSEVSHIKEICKNTVPVIFLGGKTGIEEEYCITMDYTFSGHKAVEYYYELKHRDIAVFLYHPNNKTIQQKRIGYEEKMKELGLKPHIYWEGNSNNTYVAGQNLIKKLINQKKLPTAIWCASDLMALGVINELQRNNLNVPRDISVMGHDNLFFTGIDSISLTTFTMPKEEIGIKTVEIAMNIIESKNSTKILHENEKKAIFHGKLIERESTCRFNSPQN